MKWSSYYLLTFAALTDVCRTEKAPWETSAQAEKGDTAENPIIHVPDLNLALAGDGKRVPPIPFFQNAGEKNVSPTSIPFLNFFPLNSQQVQQFGQNLSQKQQRQIIFQQKSEQSSGSSDQNPNGATTGHDSHPDDVEQQPKNSKPEMGHKRRHKTTKRPDLSEPVGITFYPTTEFKINAEVPEKSMRKSQNLNFEQSEVNVFPSAPKIADLEPQTLEHQHVKKQEVIIVEHDKNNTDWVLVSTAPMPKEPSSFDGAAFSRLANDKFSDIVKNLSLTGYIKSQDINNENLLKNISDSFTAYVEKALQEQSVNGLMNEDQEQILAESADRVIADHRRRVAQETYDRQKNGHTKKMMAMEHNESDNDDDEVEEREAENQNSHPTITHQRPSQTRFVNLPFEQNREEFAAPVIGHVIPDQSGDRDTINKKTVRVIDVRPNATLGVVGLTPGHSSFVDAPDVGTIQDITGRTESKSTFGESMPSSVAVSSHAKSNISIKSQGRSDETAGHSEESSKRVRTGGRIIDSNDTTTEEKSVEHGSPVSPASLSRITRIMVEATTAINSEESEPKAVASNGAGSITEDDQSTSQRIREGEVGITELGRNTLLRLTTQNATQIVLEPTTRLYHEASGETHGQLVTDADGPAGVKILIPDNVMTSNTRAFNVDSREMEPQPPASRPGAGEQNNQKLNTELLLITVAPQFIVPTPLVDVLPKLNNANSTSLQSQEGQRFIDQNSGPLVDNRFPTPPNWEGFLAANQEPDRRPEQSAELEPGATKSVSVLTEHISSSAPIFLGANFESTSPTNQAFVLLPDNETGETEEILEKITTEIFPLPNATKGAMGGVLFNNATNLSTALTTAEPGLGPFVGFGSPSFNGTALFGGDYSTTTTSSITSIAESSVSYVSGQAELENSNITVSGEISLSPVIEETSAAPNETDVFNTTIGLTFVTNSLSPLSLNATEFPPLILEKSTGTDAESSSVSTLATVTQDSDNITVTTTENLADIVHIPNVTSSATMSIPESTTSFVVVTSTVIEKPLEFATWRFKLTNVDWDSELSDNKSWQYKKLSDKLYPGVQAIFKDLLKNNYVNTTIVGFSQGSIIVLGRTDSTKKIDYVQFSDNFEKALRSQDYKIADYTIDPASINVDTPGGSAAQAGVKPSQRGGVPGYVVGIIIAAILVLATFFGAAYCVRRYRTRRLRDDHYVVDAETMNGGGATAAVKTWQRANASAPTMPAAGGRPAAARAAAPQPPGNAYEMRTTNPTAASATDIGVARINYGYEADSNGRQTMNGSANKV